MKISNFMNNLFAAIIVLSFIGVAVHSKYFDTEAKASTRNYQLVNINPIDGELENTTPTPSPTYNAPPLLYDDQDIYCLAKTMYFEARFQVPEGIAAVGNVVMNRLKDHHFPKTICSIVYQRTRRVCQFSWHCDGKEFDPETLIDPKKRKVWEDIKSLATHILATYNRDDYVDYSKGAVSFHAYYVHPVWRKTLSRTVRIGAHIFYKLPVRMI